MDLHLTRLPDEDGVASNTGSSPTQSTENFPESDRTTRTLASALVGWVPHTSMVEQDNWDGLKREGCICPDCGQALCNINALTRHRRTKHGVGRQWFCRQPNCTKRLKGYGRLDHFKSHMRSCHGINISSRDANIKKRHLLNSDPTQVHPHLSPEPDSLSHAADSCQGSGTQNPRVPESNEHVYHDGSAITQIIMQTPRQLTQPNVFESVAIAMSARDFEAVDRNGLIHMLQSQILECEQLRKRCKVLAMERDEYAEALKISEEMLTQEDAKRHQLSRLAGPPLAKLS